MNVDVTIPDYEMSWDQGASFAKTTGPRPHECVGLDGILETVPPGTLAAAA